MTLADRPREGGPLGTDRQAVARVLDVAAADDAAGSGQQRRADAELRVGRVSPAPGLAGGGEQLPHRGRRERGAWAG